MREPQIEANTVSAKAGFVPPILTSVDNGSHFKEIRYRHKVPERMPLNCKQQQILTRPKLVGINEVGSPPNSRYSYCKKESKIDGFKLNILLSDRNSKQSDR